MMDPEEEGRATPTFSCLLPVMIRHRSRSYSLLLLLSSFLDKSRSFLLSSSRTDPSFRSHRRPVVTNDDDLGQQRRLPLPTRLGWSTNPLSSFASPLPQPSRWLPTTRIRRGRAVGVLRAAGSGSSSSSSSRGGRGGTTRRGSTTSSPMRSAPPRKSNKGPGPEKSGAARAARRKTSSTSGSGGQRGRSHRSNDSSSVGAAPSLSSSGARSTTASGDLRDSTTPHSAPPKQEKRSERSAPPWQVMSDKDAKRNVAKELERRRLIKEGVKASHETIDGDDGAAKAQLSSSLLSDRDRQFLKWRPTLLSRSSSASLARKALALRAVGSYLGSDSRIPELGVPEVAFLGRSNVGKSSLLNRLVDGVVSDASDSAVARVGKTPGATASVNLYAIHGGTGKNRRDVLGLCDLPGFGYAKLSKQVQESVQVAAERYLSKRRHLALGVLLVDIRRTPSDDDRAVLAALYDMGVPLLVVATKLDKLSSNRQREDHLEEIRAGLGLPPNQPFAVSTVTGEGCRGLWKIILEACEGAVQEFGAKYDVGDSPSSRAHPVGSTEVVGYDDDDEDEDMSYSQGFDWIHDGEGGVFYEGEGSDIYEDE